MILVYDGTFEGFLSLVYEVYYKKLSPSKIYKNNPTQLILEELIYIETIQENSMKVYKALQTKFDTKSFSLLVNIFMCDTKEFELSLLRYIIIGFKDTKQLYNINYEEVFYLQNLEKELFRLVHKMYGFIRFQELEDGTLYAKIETKYNVLYFLGKHFFKRLNNQNFIIHDINRKLAFVKNNLNCSIENIASYEKPTLSKDEEKFDKLWKHFFKSVAIQERENKRCQQNFVPLLYRTYMNEFN